MIAFPGRAILNVISTAVFLTAGLNAYGAGFALIVGVNDCPNFRLPGGAKPRPLGGAEHDADAVAELLKSQYAFPADNVVVIKGEKATRQQIEAAFKELTGRTTKQDVFVFHFSGHGTQIDDRRPFDEKDELDEALCPNDATETGENLIVDDDLGLWLDSLNVRDVTVILDSCHSGTGTKSVDDAKEEIVPRYLKCKTSNNRTVSNGSPWQDLQSQTKGFGRRLTAFYACQADQQAYERRMLEFNPPQRAGQFTAYLLEGLRTRQADTDGDSAISNAEILEFAKTRLDEKFNPSRPMPADRQLPTLEADFPKETVFGLRAANGEK